MRASAFSVRADSAACPGANGFDEWASAPNFYENNPLFSHNGKVIEVKGESWVDMHA